MVRNDLQTEGATFPIRAVAALTGVSAFTLRAWERRYGLVVPRRSETGQRVYSAEDIFSIRHILQLVDSGIGIGHVATLLKKGVDGDAQSKPQFDFWGCLQARMSECIAAFDEDGLDQVYEESMATHSVRQVTRNLLLPLLSTVGDRWLSNDAGIAEEHFFSAYMRNKLGARLHHREVRNGARLLFACLPGERHELGLLLFALEAIERMYRPIVLGADVPLSALSVAGRQCPVEGVVLSGTIDKDDSFWRVDLANLVSSISVPVFVGGSVSLTRKRQIADIGAHYLGCDLDISINLISAVLKSVNGSSPVQSTLTI